MDELTRGYTEGGCDVSSTSFEPVTQLGCEQRDGDDFVGDRALNVHRDTSFEAYP